MTQEELDVLLNEKDTCSGDEQSVNRDNSSLWPMPSTDENKMVYQLDDVTKESEAKASEIFDLLESTSNNLVESQTPILRVYDVINSNVELFSKLTQKFPNVKAFEKSLENNTTALGKAKDIFDAIENSEESIISIMDIMQYQDIHRQKIERVINVMRSLSRYMNNLLESNVDDKKRVSSAQHIAGDTHNEVASNEDIEALLAQFVR